MTDVTDPEPGALATRFRAYTDDKRRERNPRGEGEKLRRELLENALDLLSASGNPDDVSIRAIARATGVSATAAYRHFVDRDDLVFCAVGLAFEDFQQRMAHEVAGASTPFEALRAAGAAYRKYAADQPGRYRVLFSNPMACPETTTATEDEILSGTSAFSTLVELVAACLDAGAPAGSDADPEYLSFQLWSWIHGIVDLHISHPGEQWPATEEMFIDAQRLLGLGDPDAPGKPST